MKLPRKCRVFLLAVAGLFILWLVYYAAVSVVYGLKLRSLRAQVKAEGSSLNLLDLAPKPVPREENAARWYQAASLVKNPLYFGRGKADAQETAAVEAYTAFFSAKPEERAKVVAEKHAGLSLYLDRNKLALRFLHEGAKYDRGYFELDYADGGNMKLPHLAEFRDSARMLSLEAWLAATDGDAHRACQAVWAGLRLRRSIEKEPILIGFLVGNALDMLALRTLPEILAMVNPNPEDLRLILTELQALDRQRFRRAVEGERALNAGHMESARKNGVGAVLHNEVGGYDRECPTAPETALIRILNGSLVDQAFSLSFMNRFVEAASRLETLSDEEMSHWAVDEATAAHRAGTSIGSKYYHLLSGKFLPAIGYSLCEAKRDLARHDVTACGIAAELYRLDHGTYPLSLDMLAPKYLAAVPQDVFSGKPLLFESLPNGVLIQSVGPYQRRLGDSESVPPTPPITWRIERPSPAQP